MLSGFKLNMQSVLNSLSPPLPLSPFLRQSYAFQAELKLTMNLQITLSFLDACRPSTGITGILKSFFKIKAVCACIVYFSMSTYDKHQ